MSEKEYEPQDLDELAELLAATRDRLAEIRFVHKAALQRYAVSIDTVYSPYSLRKNYPPGTEFRESLESESKYADPTRGMLLNFKESMSMAFDHIEEALDFMGRLEDDWESRREIPADTSDVGA